MGFQNFIAKIDDRLTQFSHWKWRYLVMIPGIFLLVSALYFIFCFTPLSYYEVYDGDNALIQGYCGFGSWGRAIAFLVVLLLVLTVAIVYLVFLRKLKRLTSHKLAVFFAFILSVLMLMCVFALKVNAQYGHVDWCQWNYYDATNPEYRPGHWAVILDIFRHGTVEEFPKDANGNYWHANQYYQNKFWHYLVAYFMRFNGLFIHAGDTVTADAIANNFVFTETEDVLFESTRILITSIGIYTAMAILKLLEKLGAHDSQEAIAMGLFTFSPFFIILPTIYNNDNLSFLFAILALYFTIEWHQHYSWSSILLIALCLGLGMATKFNAGMMALPIAGVFLYDLIRLYQKKEGGFAGAFPAHAYRTFWLQILAFAAVVFPLGLFFAVYQYKVYNIPFGYVWDNGSDSAIYVNPERYNVFLRFFIFPAPDMFFSIFSQPYRQGLKGAYYDVWGKQDFNIWTGFFKTLLFNQGNLDSYPSSQTLPIMIGAYLLYIVFFILAVYAMVYFAWFAINYLRGKHRSTFTPRRAFLWGIALTEILSYAYFNYRYPYVCTAHCRYILEFFFPLYLAVALGLHKGKTYLAFFHHKRAAKAA
jgi:hypothetical protein